MEASRPIVLGTGTSGKGVEKSETSRQAATWKTKAAMDCHQNNKMFWQGVLKNTHTQEHTEWNRISMLVMQKKMKKEVTIWVQRETTLKPS